jgi:hypothetical protein
MKIAQITSVYISVPPKTYGGTEWIVHYLCRDLGWRGHQVELFASGDSKVDCTLHGSKRFGVKSLQYYSARILTRISRLPNFNGSERFPFMFSRTSETL